MSRKLRVGVIGLGIGMQHARTVAAHPGAELAMLCDLDPEKRVAAAAEFAGVPCVADAETLLASDLDVVSLASFDDFHYAQACRALTDGRHVYLEKPLCLHEAETRQLAALLRSRPGLRLSSNLVLRTCPRFLRVKAEMDAGSLGAVYHLEADYLWGRLPKLTGGWRADMDFYSIIHGAAVHMVDLVLWLTGARPVSVAALDSNFATRGTRQRHNDFADPALPPRAEKAAYPGREQRGEALVSFLDTLLGTAPRPLVDEADAFDAMSVCHAAQTAVETGCECTVNYLWEARGNSK